MIGNGSLRNKILLFLLLSLLFFPEFAFSEDRKGGVEVVLSSAPVVESLPGRTISGNFLAINHSNEKEEYLEEIRLPEGWSLIIQEEASFLLEPHEKEIRVFGISIPQNAPPGTNEIIISVKSKKNPSIKDKKTFFVKVLPLYKISLSIEEKPDRVVSGLTYTIKARVFNQGNLKIRVSLIPKIHPENPFKIEPSESLEIEAGSSRLFSIQVKTDEKINRKVNQIVGITASVTGIEEKVFSEQSMALEIIPRMVGKEDPYHRIPTTLTLKGFYDSDNREGRLGGQIDFTGSGILDEKGEKVISFKFRGPQNRYGTYFNKDEYMLTFSTKGINVHLGDGIYSLSPLLGPSRTGMGIKTGYSSERFAGRIFFSQPRDKDEKIENSLGGSFAYRFTETGNIKLNFLRNSLSEGEDNYLLSLSSEVNLKKTLKIELEGGTSWEKENDYAWRIHLSGEPVERVRFFFRNYHIGPHFQGDITPGEYVSGGISFPLYRKISGEVNISKLRENYDTKSADEKTTENDELSLMGGFSWEPSPQWGFALYYRLFDRKDRLKPVNYDYVDSFLRLSFRRNISYKTVNTYLNAYIEGGKTTNRLDSTEKNTINFGFSGTLKPTPQQNYTFFINYGRDYYEDENRKTINFGLTGSWRPMRNLSFDLSYFLNQRDFEKDTYLRHNLRSRISYLLPNKHSINLAANWIESRNGKNSEISLCLSYTIPLEIPTEKKKSVGTIKGFVYDEEDPGKKPLKDVILMASGIPAVTDREGKFVFPGLKPGEYFLQVERGSIGHGKTTSEKIEAIEVKGGELSKINIGISRSGRIGGKVEVFAPKRGLIIDETISPEDYMPSGGLPEVLIEISRKNEVLRQFTDSRGEFYFEDIRPGVWKVKIYEESLPAYHVLKEKEFEVEIKPSEEKIIKIDVFKKPRKILLIEEEK